MKKIFPPENTEKFLQCALGDKYLICLLKDNEGKGVIYVMGRNDEYQCGMNEEKNSFKLNIESLTKLDIDDKLDFKYICTFKGFTAAVLLSGALWATYLLGPVSAFRYMYPFFMLIPVMIIPVFARKKKPEKSSKPEEKDEKTDSETIIDLD